MNKKISIIVPIYNVEAYLNKCLDSIVNQTYPNLQIICVIDGSPDNSLAIAQAYADKDPRVTVINQKNQGLSGARNVGLAYADGDYIMFVDSDDWLELDCCSTALNTAVKKDYDVVFWPYNKIFSNRVEKQFVYSKNTAFDNQEAVKEGVFSDLLGPSNYDLKYPYILDAKVTAHCKLYKSSILKSSNAQFVDTKEIGTEDLLFNVQVFNSVSSACFINMPLYNYLKTNETSITSVYKPELLKLWGNLYNCMQSAVSMDRLGSEYKTRFSNRIACSIIGLGLNEMNKKPSFLSARASVLKIIKNPKYASALSLIPIGHMPVHRKLCFTCKI
ncbi:glycosyltransferase family 2 protein [Pseudoalteromonas sp. 2CM36K]|uniref:glycosyltransferase family 2 protein n=1 Tax=Pseudoalteromonas sp. 2CM36K TaxID=2929854 RepID=UPI0020BF5C47|nr:glycosyltransferase family 2 protein [Pseudoalteromonas sp. 2CM36K]MCK8104715.1 glycosyltransferase [Pseudoalteromonas sp. 2CM36K]